MRLHRGARPVAASAAAAPRRRRRRPRPTAWPSPSSSVALLGFVLLGLGLLLVGLLFLGRLAEGLDLRLDLVAELDLAGVLLLGRELVPAAELAQLGRGDVELVGDPGIGAALADPGADLVEL